MKKNNKKKMHKKIIAFIRLMWYNMHKKCRKGVDRCARRKKRLSSGRHVKKETPMRVNGGPLIAAR